ncbi:hypothetical protein [Paenibacillus typhae]|nr:hypothetical protein [Paenibacillus typhae]
MNILHTAMPRRQGQRSGVLQRGIVYFAVLYNHMFPYGAAAVKA